MVFYSFELKLGFEPLIKLINTTKFQFSQTRIFSRRFLAGSFTNYCRYFIRNSYRILPGFSPAIPTGIYLGIYSCIHSGIHKEIPRMIQLGILLAFYRVFIIDFSRDSSVIISEAPRDFLIDVSLNSSIDFSGASSPEYLFGVPSRIPS